MLIRSFLKEYGFSNYYQIYYISIQIYKFASIKYYKVYKLKIDKF